MDLVKIKKSARDIRENWETLDLLEKNLLERGNEWVREMALQGQRLMAIKADLKHGDWLPWVDANCPGRYAKVKQCMRIATHWESVPELSAATSLRQALALCEAKPEGEDDTKPKHWPPHIEATLKLSKFVGYVSRFPIESWPIESKAKAKEELLPIAKDLWPERFP